MTTESQTNIDNQKKSFWFRFLFNENSVLIFSVLGVFTLIASLILFKNERPLSSSHPIDTSIVGQLGDFIGGVVGSLWAFAGVILFYLALKDQRQDIELNRTALQAQIEEFKAQKEELSMSRKIYEEQSKTMKKQRFESTFFQLLRMLHDTVNSMDVKWDAYKNNKDERQSLMNLGKVALANEKIQKIDNGKDCFGHFVSPFEKAYNAKKNEQEATDKQLELAIQSFSVMYEQYEYMLGHYFRLLYHCLSFVHSSDLIENKEKPYYCKIVMAGLSNNELMLFFYNGLVEELGQKKVKPLIEKYGLVSNLPVKKLLNESHKDFYKKSAWKR